MRRNWVRSLLGVAVAHAGACASAMWMPPSNVPVARAERNLSKYIKEHPKDAQGYYVLGRIHSLAFYSRSRTVTAFEPNERSELYSFPRPFWIPTRGDESRLLRQPPPTFEEVISHLRKSIRAFQTAIELQPATGQFHLSYAYVLEQGANVAGEAKMIPSVFRQRDLEPELVQATGDAIRDLRNSATEKLESARRLLRANIRDVGQQLLEAHASAAGQFKAEINLLLVAYWREAAAEEYLRAFDLENAGDLDDTNERAMFYLSELVSFEAGEAYLRLTSLRDATIPADSAQIARVRKGVETLRNTWHQSAVTPIILTFLPHTTIDDLLADGSGASFDLDGDGIVERWPWLKPSTGLLVWDPRHEGKITSGRQLFGSVTWWMFFRDGYQALDALDDNRDGWLSGAELPGLAVWFDRNSDGTSDPGEVIPIEQLGIRALATRATGHAGQSPMNSAGLRMNDGRVLPTYDWVTSPISEQSSRRAAP